MRIFPGCNLLVAVISKCVGGEEGKKGQGGEIEEKKGGGFTIRIHVTGFTLEAGCVVLCYVFVYKFKSGSPELRFALMNNERDYWR